MSSPIKPWGMSRHFQKIHQEGRNRPPPEFGSPTMVWHFGVWRRNTHARTGTENESVEDLLNAHGEETDNFYREIQEFLVHLQEVGCARPYSPKELPLKEIDIEGTRHSKKKFKNFRVFREKSLSFDMWWRDVGVGKKNYPLKAEFDTEEEKQNALRVHVQFQSFEDYVTFSFYIDVPKLAVGKHLVNAEAPVPGARRGRLKNCLDALRQSAHGEITSGNIAEFGWDRGDAEYKKGGTFDPRAKGEKKEEVSENHIESAEFLFNGIWDEFREAFEVSKFFLPEEDPRAKNRNFSKRKGISEPSWPYHFDQGVAYVCRR